MLIDIKVPQLSESVSEASVNVWHIKEGDSVTRDQNLADIETDKVMLETPAPGDGVVIEIIKQAGEPVTSGDLLAKIDTSAKATVQQEATEQPTPTPGPIIPTPSATLTHETGSAASASPSARKIIEEKGVDASKLGGSGRGGRITKADALRASATDTTSAATISATGRPEQRVPMTRLRARIAERLLQSKNENAILTTFNEVDMSAVIALRKQYGDKFEKAHDIRLGFMGFFVKAACAALERFPIVNASIEGNDIVYHGYIDVGIAVGSPRGLVVPILRDANLKNIAEIEKEITEFGVKARDGKLSIEELMGGTFSISNGGVFGSMLSTPIINPPQSAILGIHATKDRPVAVDGQVVIRPINYLALSYDHRIIDGREAVLSLVAMKEALEDPARLLLGI